MSEITVAEALVQALHARGTQRAYGVPGGGSSLDLIAAAEALGMTFVLARNENAAMMMAAADAEVTGAPGLCLTTKGPGLAQAMNGLTHAALDRAPVCLVTDGFSEAQAAYITHQVFDQKAMSAPVVNAHARLESDDPGAEIAMLLDAMLTPPFGPVHVELTGPAARRKIATMLGRATEAQPVTGAPGPAADLLRTARRPVIVAGLEACGEEGAAAVRHLAERLQCPVLTTYKAKGVLPEGHPLRVGLFTGGAAEAPTVDQADLIILAGLDPVELILQPWRYAAPVLDIGATRHKPHYVTPKAGLYGPLHALVETLLPAADVSDWGADEIASLRADMADAVRFPASNSIDPVGIVTEAAAVFGKRTRIAVDAGAHMFSATAFWPAHAPRDLLISNGLASMAFALPAAIAAALAEPERRCLAFTGDGGLMMCLGELGTASQYGAPVTVIVFNDGALSLIDIKQQSRGLAPAGVRWPKADFAAVARGFGCAAWRVETPEAYRAALKDAAATPGPSLIDVVIDPSGYKAQLKAMRG